MTDKEKAKAYDKALEIAKNEINIKGIGETVELCERLFPELHENEDEKVREWLVDYFKTIGESKSWIHRGVGPKQILAWLEKQKEQKPVEWNDKDKRMLDWCESVVRGFEIDHCNDDKSHSDWLKSLSPQYHEDFFKEGIGHYFFDGEKAHFCGSPSMETNEN